MIAVFSTTGDEEILFGSGLLTDGLTTGVAMTSCKGSTISTVADAGSGAALTTVGLRIGIAFDMRTGGRVTNVVVVLGT